MLISKVILFDTRIPEKDFLYYSIPEEFKKDNLIGNAVIVPLKKRKVLGYIWDLLEDSILKDSISIKPVYLILKKIPSLPKSLISLINWISEYYENSLYKSANYIFPSGVELKIKRKFKRKEYSGVRLTKKQELLLEYLKEEKSLEDIKKNLKVSENLIKKLINMNLIEEEIELEIIEKHPRKEFFYEPRASDWNIKKEIVDECEKFKENTNNIPYLLLIENRRERWEYYLKLIKDYFNEGKQILVIFPTLNSLQDFQTFLIERIPIRFYTFHGFLTPAQSYQIFKISGTESPLLVISTGKGIFLPFNNLGTIILDEEENEVYNLREREPRFDIGKVVLKRAELEKIPVFLGSSSPSVSSFYNFLRGKFLFYRKTSSKCKITILSMRKEKGSVLSYYSIMKITETLKSQKQVFFLLNRLGYSTYIQCQDCGYTFYCPYCSTSLVYHSDKLELKCSYCGYRISSITTCPKCDGYSFTYGGIGTEKLENYLKRIFPKSLVQRWDSDWEVKDESLLHKSQMIVGTSLIVPWIPRLNVGLLIIINLDNFLHVPDFSTAEKTFNLLRRILSDFPGKEIIIQTFSPNHYLLNSLKKNSYNIFLHHELNLRKTLKYPPFSTLHQILLIGEDEEELIWAGDRIRKRLEENLENIEILGPAPYFPYILRGKYRYQILVKVLDEKNILRNLSELVLKDDIFSSYKVIINKDVKEIL
ncbi:MAG: primosomal protein N' [Dictyoglomus sp.]|nr:primosomal protein N' [Dictyoglomus sp.]MCX7942562.1 primosomal protein N' [Dictyoglomaceae bacterium]MDW8188800.1 primosomal protein N' [Dictyoglomus sp.]